MSFRAVVLASLFATSLLGQVGNPPPVNPKLTQHSNFFDPPEIWDLQKDARLSMHVPPGLTYRAYSAVGFDLANTIVLIGPKNELVIIDTLGDTDSVKHAIAEFRKKGILPAGPLPIRAIIYTHNHIDHIGGVTSFIADADRPACPPEAADRAGSNAPLDADALPCITLIGQEKIVQGVNNTATIIGTAINNRSAYMYGSFLPPKWVINDGIGPQVNRGTAVWVAPSRTFADAMDLVAAGIHMQIVYVPSETDDELSVFVPDAKNGGSGPAGLLQSAEVIQGPSFPNLYSLRGTSYRNPAQWFRSVDVLRKYDSWCMLPSHGTPLCGAKNIHTLLVNFRDAIQYTHDQSVRYMNLGYTSAEIPLLVTMPQYLITNLKAVDTAKGNTVTNPEDYLTFFYGSVPQAVRELYFGYLGWYNADPVALAPTPPQQYASKMVKLLGGSSKVLTEAKNAFTRGEYQWSAELATLLVTMDPQNQPAREAKANAYWQLAAPQTNPNWRNWYITAANELRHRTPTKAFTGGLTSPGIVQALPFGTWVNQWTLRLLAEKTISGNVDTSLGLWFDSNEGYVLHVRKAICELIEAKSEAETKAATNAISLTRATTDQLIDADTPTGDPPYMAKLAQLMASGAIPVTKGTPAGVLDFFKHFQPAPKVIPPLAGR